MAGIPTTGRSSAPRMRRAVTDDDKLVRRAEILTAAKAVFAERGFSATTMADIARAAGVSYGVAYWYFASKDELFTALMAEEEAALRAHIVRAFGEAPATDLRAVLHGAVFATFEFFEADRAAAALLFRDSLVLGHDFDKHLVGMFGRFIDDFEVSVRSAKARGEVAEVPSRLVAFTVTAMVSQLAIRRLSVDDGFSAEEAAGFVVSMVFDGIGTRR